MISNGKEEGEQTVTITINEVEDEHHKSEQNAKVDNENEVNETKINENKEAKTETSTISEMSDETEIASESNSSKEKHKLKTPKEPLFKTTSFLFSPILSAATKEEQKLQDENVALDSVAHQKDLFQEKALSPFHEQSLSSSPPLLSETDVIKKVPKKLLKKLVETNLDKKQLLKIVRNFDIVLFF